MQVSETKHLPGISVQFRSGISLSHTRHMLIFTSFILKYERCKNQHVTRVGQRNPRWESNPDTWQVLCLAELHKLMENKARHVHVVDTCSFKVKMLKMQDTLIVPQYQY